jgi:hypothetical protein
MDFNNVLLKKKELCIYNHQKKDLVMVKKSTILTMLSIGLMGIFDAYSNPAGPLVRITQSGDALNNTTGIQICLNALDSRFPLSCQNFTITQNTITITPVITGHLYPNPGVKVTSSAGLSFFQQDGSRGPVSGGYALFSMSSTTPKTLVLGTSSFTLGTLRDGGIVGCVAAPTRTGQGDGPPICTNTDLIVQENDPEQTETWGPLLGLTGADSPTNGAQNTTILAGLGAAYQAATYCANLIEGGFEDW